MNTINIFDARFVRLAWASKPASEIWGTRFRRIEQVLRTLSWSSVDHRIFPSCIITISPGDLVQLSLQWQRAGLAFYPFNSYVTEAKSTSCFCEYPLDNSEGVTVMQVLVATTEALPSLVEAIEGNNHRELLSLLGWPECCTQQINTIGESADQIDPVWEFIAKMNHTESDLPAAVVGAPQMNPFLRVLGIGLLPYISCSVNCKCSFDSTSRIIELARTLSFDQEINWLLEILSWPIEWSALHGIAEIKTPVFKFISNAFYTPNQVSVRWTGESYMRERPTETDFPHERSEPNVLVQPKRFPT